MACSALRYCTPCRECVVVCTLAKSVQWVHRVVRTGVVDLCAVNIGTVVQIGFCAARNLNESVRDDSAMRWLSKYFASWPA